MEKVMWKVSGMDCTNCALTITKYLEKQNVQNVKVNFIGGSVMFDTNNEASKPLIIKGISDLGYTVISEDKSINTTLNKNIFKNHLQRFLFCLPFTMVLMLHMLPMHIHFLMNGWMQLIICLPVFILGMQYFGLSAVKSLRKGVPNMNVLIAIGALAAFAYSLIGTINNMGMDYIFYETTATIITLVFLGEWIEHKAVETTQAQLRQLNNHQKVMANMIAFDDDHKEQIFAVENTQLHVGDLILIKTGEQVPTDCKILWGNVQVSEALLTGESNPIAKQKKDNLIGASLVLEGTVKAQVTAVGSNTVLSNIINLVTLAQNEKPPIQQLADKISAIFVPLVLTISAITFLINFFIADVNLTNSIMRSIAVLVISCPCAMGLATPAAIAVGLGRAAKNGILFRDAKSLELFKNIQTVVFDKTGTLTTGKFSITDFYTSINEDDFKQIVFSLEKYSNHPIAKTIVEQWKNKQPIAWKKIEEIKGQGLEAEDADGNKYVLGKAMTTNTLANNAKNKTAYLYKNNELIGWIFLEDEIRTEAKMVVDYLHQKNIDTILLSGDNEDKCAYVALKLGIKKTYANQSPTQKFDLIKQLNKSTPIAMIGDGINDAPALAEATIGISLSEASQIAMQTAQVVLTQNGITKLPLALSLGKQTYVTIKQNLFWAFIYNIVAIPIAAFGLLQPGFAALAMGLSDVVLIINSARLRYKKL